MSLPILCAIHCVLSPILLSLLPLSLGSSSLWVHNPILELLFLVLSFLIALPIFFTNYKKHRKKKILALFTISLFLIILNFFFGESQNLENWLGVPGNLLLSVSLIWNLRHQKQS
ncbi:MAG: MerC domain-containing protein [Leptospiraceae bacterium]|nr:MerC domain-containing protein [Leptospiraceae bacterium]